VRKNDRILTKFCFWENDSMNERLLEFALIGFEARKVEIEAAIADIRGQLGQRSPGRASVDGAARKIPRKRVLSADAKRRIAEGQRKRWAAVKKQSAAPKRKLSAAGRKAIVAALKRRWAAKREAVAS
jgi:hypothetical protein